MAFLILLTVYFLFVVLLILGFRRQKEFRNSGVTPAAEVLIAFRNEENNLKTSAESLIRQANENDTIRRVTWIDDHSTDNGRAVLEQILKEQDPLRFRILSSDGQGKKAALRTGLKQVESEVVLTLDADVVPEPDWAPGMIAPFADDRIQMVCGPVHIRTEGSSPVASFEAIDVLSLIASARSLIQLGFPVMNNGANLAYRHCAFQDVNGFEGNEDQPSGDDVFLLHKIANRFPGGVYSPSPEIAAGVITDPQPSVGALIGQRVRWAGKSKSYRSAAAQLVALWIALICLVITVGLPLSFFHAEMTVPLICLWTGKATFDAVFLYRASSRYGRRLSPGRMWLLGMMYPFYTTWIALKAGFSGYTWKGRQSS